MTKDLAAFAKEKGVKYFMISFTDLFGAQRAKLVPAQAIADMQAEGAGFAGSAAWLDMTPAHPDMFAIPDADAVGEVGNIQCGDALKLFLKIDKEDDRITNAKFETFGCGSAIASSSALTELIIGKTVDESLKVTNDVIAGYLDGLPEAKMHCSVMGRDALEAAISKYRGEHPTGHEEDEGTIVCQCFGVTDEKIKREVRENNLSTVEQVTHYCKAGGGCTSCHSKIEELIEEVHGGQPPTPATPVRPRKLTNIEKMKLIQETIDREIRPALMRDGGDLELVDIVGDRVFVSTRGMCAGCASAPITLKSLVEAKLREFVSPDLSVEEVAA